jgi:branched-chain amino acid transport system permease protein
MKNSTKPWSVPVLILAAVVVLPFVVRPVIAAEIWLFAIFGLGLNLLLGYTGLLSFGQSTFFGSAAYVAGWLLKHYAINVFLALGVGIGVGALSALLVGYLCVQRSGLYFIMLTFALNQLFFFIAYQWTSVTGGEDGMPGVPRPELLGLDFKNPMTYYVFVSILFLLSLWVMKRIVESPLGRILQAIRENEVRAEAVGYNVPRFKLLAFVIGGAFSGLAGVLYAMLFGIVPLEAIGFVFSGNVVFATLIGGSGSLYGPIIGSFVFIWLSESMSVVWTRWPLLLGVAFVIVVLFFRGGVVEAWTRLLKWQSSRRKASQSPSAR